MFTLGDFNASDVDGLAAVLTSWPGMPEVTTHTVAAPGGDGVFYADSTLGPARFAFNLYAQGVDPEDVLGIAETVSGTLHPAGGLRTLTLDIADGWQWRANTDSPIEWTRGRWEPGSEVYLQAHVEFVATDPYGYAVPDDTYQWGGPGSHSFTRSKGNVPSRPLITLTGLLARDETVTVTLGGTSITVNGPLSASETLRLDYQNLDFGVWDGATKKASVVNRMSAFTVLQLPPDSPIGLAVDTTGTISNVTIDANSRRL